MRNEREQVIRESLQSESLRDPQGVGSVRGDPIVTDHRAFLYVFFSGVTLHSPTKLK